MTLRLERIEHEDSPEGHAAVAWLYDGHPVARGVIAVDALPALQSLLENPVTIALAAREDGAGNIDGRVCLVLPIGEEADEREEEEPEPWSGSVPPPPFEEEGGSGPGAGNNLALLPIGNVVRSAANRNHRELADDAREMLANLLAGRARDAVARAIDDLLGSL